MTEMYTIMRYIEPQVLADAGIHTFDNWASTFAKIEQCNELKPECDGKFQTKTRVSNYACFDQLRTMFAEVADIKTADMLHLERPDYELETIKAPASRAVRREMQKISKRADKIRQGAVDPSEDNMLKLTTDGKKVGLDIRMINPDAKDDPHSKINLCVEKVMDIYKETTSKSGVQMIFCDMGTPKKEPLNSFAIYKADETGEYEFAYRNAMSNGDDFESIRKRFSNGKSMPKDYDRESFGKINPGDIIVVRTLDDNGNAINTAKMVTEDEKLIDADKITLDNIGIRSFISADEISKRFCVYDDIKSKLMAQGVPEKEIAFIHDYDKAADKQLLYNQMNEGKVRIMIGSTQKCGAGMNAQKKMVALHHLDVPARPSDVEQRNGRILRRGNENKHVRIFRYVTDRTFDAYSFQILENKQKFISQAMTGQIKVKRVEDVQNAELSYAEAKALCAGNPLIKTKNDLEVEVNELKILKANFDRQKYIMQDNVMKKLPLDIQNTQNTIKHLKEDIQFVSEQKPLINEEGKEYYPVTINGKEYSDKEMVGKYIVALAQSAMEKEKSIGQYKGFELSVLYDCFQQKNMACLKSPNNGKKYYCQLNMDENVSAASNIRRLDNLLNNTLGQQLVKAQENLTNLNSELEISRRSMNEPFPRTRELEEKAERLREIELELQASSVKCKDIELDLYEQLNELFPQIISKGSTYIQLEAGEAFDKLNVEWVSENEIAVSHTYEQNGDIMRDPEIVFSINTDDFTASAVSYENSSLGKYEIYDESEESQAMKDDCNIFASEWFDNISEQGYVVSEKGNDIIEQEEPEQEEFAIAAER